MKKKSFDDSDILKAREGVKVLEGITYDQIREMDVEKLRGFIVKYYEVLYNSPIDKDTLVIAKTYLIAQNMHYELPKIASQRTKSESGILFEMAKLRTAEGAQRDALIQNIERIATEAGLTVDNSPMYQSYVQKKGKISWESNYDSSAHFRDGRDGLAAITHQEAQPASKPNQNNSVDIEKIKEQRKNREEQEGQEILSSDKYKSAVQRAKESGKFWPELVDYVFNRLNFVGGLETGLNVGFPQKVEKGYETKISYVFLQKSFDDIILELISEDVNSDKIRGVRQNAFKTGKKNLSDVLGLEVFENGDKLEIMSS